MICTFLRSSSINTYNLCEHRYFLEYNLNIKGGHSKATLIGSTLHAVMESLALCKLAEQNNKDRWTHSEFGDWLVIEYDWIRFLEYIYNKYDEENPGLFDDKSYRECFDLVLKALTYSNGAYCPDNQTIEAVEFFFDIEIDQPWARYNYNLPDGKKLTGNLSLKGSIDLISRQDEKTLVITDYKSSKSINDWNTGKEKNNENLREDTQLQLYFYALAKSFSAVETFIFILYFVRLDIPFTVIFDRNDLPKAEEFIRKQYESIRSNYKPSLLIDDKNNNWKCFRLCPHWKSLEENGQNTCTFYRNEINKLGYKKAMAKHADFELIDNYGDGGSQKDVK
jgi:ATP-dependent helicase/DNAse subunit B